MTKQEWYREYRWARHTGPVYGRYISPIKAMTYAAMAWVSNKKKTGEWK